MNNAPGIVRRRRRLQLRQHCRSRRCVVVRVTRTLHGVDRAKRRRQIDARRAAHRVVRCPVGPDHGSRRRRRRGCTRRLVPDRRRVPAADARSRPQRAPEFALFCRAPRHRRPAGAPAGVHLSRPAWPRRPRVRLGTRAERRVSPSPRDRPGIDGRTAGAHTRRADGRPRRADAWRSVPRRNGREEHPGPVRDKAATTLSVAWPGQNGHLGNQPTELVYLPRTICTSRGRRGRDAIGLCVDDNWLTLG